MAEGRSKSASGKGLANSNLPEKNDAVKSSLKDDQKTLARPRLQILLGYLKLNALLVLGAAISEASKLNLSPVYGSIPSSRNHFTLVTTLYAAGGIAALQWPMSRLWRLELLPVLAYWIPVTQHFLFGYSQTFRASHGPWVTEILSIGPLLFLLGACSLQFKNTNGGRWTTIAERGVAQVTFVWSMSYAESFMTSRIGQSLSYTRIAYLIEIAMGFTATAPSKLLFLVIPALLHTAILNPHVQTPSATTSLETSLRYQNFTLLARQESLTGYISVLETTSDTEYNYRVMRCDHSLLGGEWVMPQGEAKVPEPIYSIFTMLQAVRLVKSPIITGLPADEKNALVIGAGVGTSPGALIAHGIDTTIVEIDPVVLEYATTYFGLSKNHTAVVADAVPYMKDVAKDHRRRYDYIIHDVFTGGAEPVDLFTQEFLRTLQRSLKPNGVVAINYASDLLQPTTHLILRTIFSVFPSCRIFRELEQPSAEQIEEDGQDFTNMVVFCHAQNTRSGVHFRKPVEADYLGSPSIKAYLVPKFEIPLEGIDISDLSDVLRMNNTRRLAETQKKSAMGHWRVMRTVLPPKVWELW